MPSVSPQPPSPEHVESNSLAICFLSLPACSHLTTSVRSTCHGACDMTVNGTCTSNCRSQPTLIFGNFWEPHKLFLVHEQGHALPWGSSQEVEMNANCEGFTHTWRRHQPCTPCYGGLPLICMALEEPSGSLPLQSTPSGSELWCGAPGAGDSLCLWPGIGWRRGCSGEQSGRCLGDQILSQEARGLARQSPGAQDWVPGGVLEVDGAGSWVGH